MNVQELLGLLEELEGILLREKEALMISDGETLAAVVEEKTHLTVRMAKESPAQEEFLRLSPEEKSHLEEKARAVRDLQETNMLLTRQALHYAETILQALQGGAEEAGEATYSQDGNTSRDGRRSRIVDRSV